MCIVTSQILCNIHIIISIDEILSDALLYSILQYRFCYFGYDAK